MRIVILGNGALGCVLAGYLAHAGHAVTLAVRRERLSELDGRPLRVSGLAAFTVPVAWSASGSIPNGDLLMVTVKAFQTAAALNDLGGARFDVALSLQNGIVKNDLLQEHFPGRVIGATTQVGGELVAPAHARHVLDGRTYLGELDGDPSERVRQVVTALSQAGLPTEERRDIRGVEWSKLCQYAGAALVAATSRRLLHEIYLDEDLARLYLRVVREAATVAARTGVEPADVPAFPIATLTRQGFDQALDDVRQRGDSMRQRGITAVRSSLLQALEAGRPTELEDTAGWLVATAERLGVTVPTIEALYRLVRSAIR